MKTLSLCVLLLEIIKFFERFDALWMLYYYFNSHKKQEKLEIGIGKTY